MEACGVDLEPGARNEFRIGLINTLQNYLEETIAHNDRLESHLESTLLVKKRAGRIPESPVIASATMKALLNAYGDSRAEVPNHRQTAIAEARTAVDKDPYFAWLRRQGKGDPVEFFFEPLNTGGSGNLKLSHAILRLRATMDPRFSPLNRSIVSIILSLRTREYKIAEQLRTLRSGEDGGAWNMARSLDQAKAARLRISRSIRANSADGLTIGDHEKLNAFLTDNNPDTEILRRYLLSLDGGIYAGQLQASEIAFLEAEAARIRQQAGFSDKIVFNAKFLETWRSIWGARLPYDFVLLRHFYFPESDRQKIETQLRSLNLYIELAHAARTKETLGEYYDALIKAEPHRFPYLISI